MAADDRDRGTAEAYSLTFPTLRSPLPSFSLAFFVSPPFRCWLLSTRIREHHELFSSTTGPSSDAGTDVSETSERSTTETSSQSTEATQVMRASQLDDWLDELYAQRIHDRFSGWIQALSLDDLVGLEFGECKVVEVFSNMILTSDTVPVDLTAWRAEFDHALELYNVDVRKLLWNWVMLHLKRQGKLSYSPILLPWCLATIYRTHSQTFQPDAELRKDCFQAIYVLGLHSNYSSVTYQCAQTASRLYSPVWIFPTDSIWDRFKIQVYSQWVITSAVHGFDSVYRFETIQNHQQMRKEDALREEGEKAFQLRRFETAYHGTLHRMCQIIKAERKLRKEMKIANDLIGESEEISPLHAKLMKIQLDCTRAAWLLHRMEDMEPCGEGDEDRLNLSYDMYREIRDRAYSLGLKNDHRWMLHLDFHISLIEIRYLQEYDRARARLKRMIKTIDGNIPSEVHLIRIALLYSDCLESLGKLDEADIWRRKSFNIYRRLMEWELEDVDMKEARALDQFTWDHVDKLFQYDCLDALDMEYGVIASE